MSNPAEGDQVLMFVAVCIHVPRSSPEHTLLTLGQLVSLAFNLVEKRRSGVAEMSLLLMKQRQPEICAAGKAGYYCGPRLAATRPASGGPS